jgi:tRNA(Leu) C34 or U34 (ribose-2'-O)-methylase TrmL
MASVRSASVTPSSLVPRRRTQLDGMGAQTNGPRKSFAHIRAPSALRTCLICADSYVKVRRARIAAPPDEIVSPVHVPPFDQPLDEIRRELDRLRAPMRIAIQRSKNGFNVGAIIRVAHSFLVREIILIGEEPYYERASMGMERYENITLVASEAAFVERIKSEGLRVVAIEKDHPRTVSLWDYTWPETQGVMVFGSENFGVSPEILAVAEAVVAIPMFGINHSYPVSVAAGITLGEWGRRYWGGNRLLAVPHTEPAL